MGPQTTELAKEAFRRALDEAKRLKHDSVRAEHILLGVLQLSGGSASAALDAAAVDRIAVAHGLEALLPSGEAEPHAGEYPYHPSGARLIRNLFTPALEEQAGKLTSGRVLLGLLRLDHAPIVEALTAAGQPSRRRTGYCFLPWDRLDRVYFTTSGEFVRRETFDGATFSALWSATGGSSEGGQWMGDGLARDENDVEFVQLFALESG